MLRWALAFLLISILAGAFGLAGPAGTAADIAKMLFLLFLVLFVISMVVGRKFLGGPSV